MGFLDGLEKLINEHGSATILKERIALANDKYSALEKELSASKLREEESKAREIKLEAENQRLKSDNVQLRQEIQRRDDIIQKEIPPLDNVKISILKLLFDVESMAPDQISQSLDVALQMANFHLEELLKAKLIKPKNVMRERIIDLGAIKQTQHFAIPGYSIEQIGRKYLIENGEIA